MADRKPLCQIDGVKQEFPAGDSAPVNLGGTGLVAFAVGDLIYASGTTALSKLAAAAAGNALLSGTSPSWGKITSSHVDSSISLAGHTHAHSTITGLTSGDDHTQYALLTGRSGGQVFYGSTAAGENLDLHSTSHASKGLIRFRNDVSGGNGSDFDFWVDVTGASISRMRFTSGNITVGNNLNIYDGAISVFTIEGAENDSTGPATIASLAFVNDSNRASQTNSPIAQISASVADLSVGPNLGQLDFYTKDGTTLLKRATITKDGRLGIGTTPTATLHLQAGGTAVSSAPLKFTSGSLLTTPEVGAVEFLTDAFYATITTGAARKTFAFLESPSFTTPTLGVATATSLACPTFTSSAAMGFTPAAGSGFNINLSTTGDFAVNTNKLFVDTSTGNVGIGTTGPNTKLHVFQGTSNSNGQLQVGGGTAIGNQLSYEAIGSGRGAWSDLNNAGGSNNQLNIGFGAITSGVPANVVATFNQAGNVGIGITAPTALCHLGASTTARASLCIPSGTAPTSPVNGDIWYDGTNLKFRDGGTTRTLTWV